MSPPIEVPFINYELKYKLEYLLDVNKIKGILEEHNKEKLNYIIFDIIAIKMQLKEEDHPELIFYLDQLSERARQILKED